MICGKSLWPCWLRYWLSGRGDPPGRPTHTAQQSPDRHPLPWPSLRLVKLLPLIGLALSGCSTKPNSDVNGCDAIKLVEYAPPTQARVAAEIRRAGQNDYMPDWIKDYGGLRAQVRACQSVKP